MFGVEGLVLKNVDELFSFGQERMYSFEGDNILEKVAVNSKWCGRAS